MGVVIGVGYTAVTASFFLGSFYTCIMGWALLYFVYSFYYTLPWTRKTWQTVDIGEVRVDGNPGIFFG